MSWLRMIKEHIITSFHLDMDNLDYPPFDSRGGIAKLDQLFGYDLNNIIDELNEELVA
jgi:type I restriction enzyme R subunit